jgi:hypothetical protein
VASSGVVATVEWDGDEEGSPGFKSNMHTYWSSKTSSTATH